MIVDAKMFSLRDSYVFDIIKLPLKFANLTKRDGDPIRLRCRPLQLVNFRAASDQDGSKPPES